MPPTLTLDRPPISNLRERWLKKQLDRLSAIEKSSLQALQAPKVGLSPLEADLNRQHSSLVSEALARTKASLDAVRMQNVAIKNQPLIPRSSKSGSFYRTEADRNAAILGILQRERRQTASLTREGFITARAQAMAASRRNAVQARLGGYPVGVDGPTVRVGGKILASHEVLLDPCEEMLRKQRNRREVMAAKSLLGVGYHTKHIRKVC